MTNEMQSVEHGGNTRRGFLKLFTGALGSLVALTLGIPLVGTLVGPLFRMKKSDWAKVAEIGSLPVGQPIKLSWTDQKVDMVIREKILRDVWAIKHSSSEVTIFSPICPHLGCRYDWHPETQEFICPCHESVFSIDGKVLRGPAPRPLDTLPTRLENGAFFIEWETFKIGIPEKIPV